MRRGARRPGQARARRAPDGHTPGRAARLPARLPPLRLRTVPPRRRGARRNTSPRARERNTPRGSRSGGAGLGLAIVAAIARAHGGRATADNPPGGGARVCLHLPLHVAGPETHGPAPGLRVRPPVRPPALPGRAPQPPADMSAFTSSVHRGLTDRSAHWRQEHPGTGIHVR
ncbi:ATP-binding protein [Streptomyces sp. YGL11-2]|uniref:ATP-binding protein n=1 Tax=Streptomyces sp. YGL11-2 TaxID=3414028 RepID=UPI003CED82DB